MKISLPNQLHFIQCSNAACKAKFLVNSKEIEHGKGVYLCSECFLKSKTHHTIQCSLCLSIIDFLETENGETVTTYYSKKCTCCTGTVDDEIRISKKEFVKAYV